MDLDDLSNRALDAIEARKYERAEELCRQLLEKYPEAFDGHERLAMLREAQGRFTEAAEHYATVLELMRQNPDNVDQETIDYVNEMREEALARAKV
jgi:tetratricopeptide (TPR) repeat protein